MSSQTSVLTLSFLGTREWIRLKFFNIVVFTSILFLGFSYLLSTLTFAVQDRLLFDFGLGGLEIGLLFISAMMGSYAIQREIDRKTLFVLLVRPLPRWHIVVGSFGSLFILSLIFTVGFGFSLMISSGQWQLFNPFLICAGTSFLKSLVFSSFALAMGLIVRPILSLALTFCYWILSYSVPDIEFFTKKLESPGLNQFVRFLDTVIPQFYRINWKAYYFLKNPPTGIDFLWAFCTCMGWTFFWLFVASHFFRRKEIV